MQKNDLFTKEDEFYLMQGYKINEDEAKTYGKSDVIRILEMIANLQNQSEKLVGIMREIADKETESLLWKYANVLIRAEEYL